MDLQVLRHDELAAKAQQNTQREFWQAPRRGDILDAHGNLLATSIPVKTVCADPSLIGNQQAVVAHALAPLLQMNEGELVSDACSRAWPKMQKGETVTTTCTTSGSNKNVSDETWQKIQTGDEPNFPSAWMKRNCRRPTASFSAICAEARFSPTRWTTDAGLSERLAGGAGARVSGVEDAKMAATMISQIVGRDGIELVAEFRVERRRRLARDRRRTGSSANWSRCAMRTCRRATA